MSFQPTHVIAPAAPARTPARVSPAVNLRVGSRFFNRGLRCYCEVLEVDLAGIVFTTRGGEPLTTDCPLDIAARHFASGEWDLAARGPGEAT